ncbi:MAG TPA: NAD-binding protein [Burkholderiales bacterium]|nr:NAD-binding protein [Burkholderiales bacterium]
MSSLIFFLGLRRLRGPLILMVAVFATAIAGLVLIPGVGADGREWHMSFSQALYFMSYTATTIGFGEIPYEFTDTQRLWVTAMIFGSVIAWAYLVASLLALARDAAFRGALTAARFTRAVHALREPFYLICGFGETGRLVGRALDQLGHRFSVIDIDPARIQQLSLMDLAQDAPALVADARSPDNLTAAGLTRPECAGVLALTNDEQANLAVAMAVRLLNPRTPVLARALSNDVIANMASFNTDHVINPFARFGEYLALALHSPASYRLISWLTGLPGTTLEPETAPPHGHWVVCGYGRFGCEVVEALREESMQVCVIDPKDLRIGRLKVVKGVGTEAEPLIEAGVRDAVGIVAGTDDDITNLSIAVTARELNANLFTIVRQATQANRALFEAFDADITIVATEIAANECLTLIRTPRLAGFLSLAKEQDAAWAEQTIQRLQSRVGTQTPEIWSVSVSPSGAPALHRAIQYEGCKFSLGDLERDPANRDDRLDMMALSLTRGGDTVPLPDPDEELQADDDILYAGTPQARHAQWPILRNINVCYYVATGADPSRGWIWQQFRRKASGC